MQDSKDFSTSSRNSPRPASTLPPKTSSEPIGSSRADAFAMFSTRVRDALRQKSDSPIQIHHANRSNHLGKVPITSPLRQVTFMDALDQRQITLTHEHVARLNKLVERLKTAPNLKAWYRIRSDFVKDFPSMAEVKPSKLMELYDSFHEEDCGASECAIADSPDSVVQMTASDEEREELYAPRTPPKCAES